MMEPERYELLTPALRDFDTDRRGFLRALGGGLLVVGLAAGQESGSRGRRGAGRQMPSEMSAWLHIGQDGAISVFTGKAEVGQNTRTSLTQAIAEELRTPIEAIQLVMADTDRVPFDAGTFGSQSTPVMAPQLHRVGAAAREMLIDMAARQWGVDRRALSIRNGEVTDGKRRSGFGALTQGQQLVSTVDAGSPVTPAGRWTVCGTSLPKVNGRDMVTGKHRYTCDFTAPGMLHGKVLRPTAFGARLESLDTREAEALPGVTVVRDGDFAAVAAADATIAAQALRALRAGWKSEQQLSHRELFQSLRTTAGPPQSIRAEGSVEDGLRTGEVRLDATYTVAYIAHVPLEPRAALAQWEGEKLTVYTGTQRPFGVREELANAFHIPSDRVRVIVPDTGSGYGGKHTGEAALEAARIARTAGRPVKVVWTREEEFTWAYARPAGVLDVRAAARRDGSLTAWELRNYNSGVSGIRGLYNVPAEKLEFYLSNSPLRQGSYRALAATANHFARESHINELAHAAGIDPVAFRLRNLTDPRQRGVLEAAAAKFGWQHRRAAPGRGSGIAVGFEKNGYVSSAVEVEADRATGKVRLLRVVTAFDCGAVVNPDGLKNQVEGAIVMGLGGALFEALLFENGRITNARLRTYRVPRFSDCPLLETVLIDRKDVPSAGAGEAPLVALAPAVAAAIFEATGQRLRSLPLAPDEVK